MVLQELLKYFNTETRPKSKTKKVIRNKKVVIK